MFTEVYTVSTTLPQYKLVTKYSEWKCTKIMLREFSNSQQQWVNIGLHITGQPYGINKTQT